MSGKVLRYTLTTGMIEITVTPQFEVKESNPAIGKFIFSYHIDIVNKSANPVQLISRHWHIYDSLQVKREIEGQGVIGLQPVIQPDEIFSYTSYCHINSPIGKMYGTYHFIRKDQKIGFEVEIPVFLLLADFILN